MKKLLCLLLCLSLFVPMACAENADTMPWNTFCAMLTDAIHQCDPALVPAWNETAAKAMELKFPMDRDDAILTLYEAACVLGLGADARIDWNDVNTVIELQGNNQGYSPNDRLFSNAQDEAPYESNPGQFAHWNYPISARFFALGQSSAFSTDSFFLYPSESVRYDDLLTAQEAEHAVSLLILAYQAAHSGGYALETTDWTNPLLAAAAEKKEAILSSETTVIKGEKLVPGETYSGTAYYISNTGSDKNSGRSPEKAWASLDKLKNATLKSGDAVFFERGGIWYGSLSMRSGVTYSAYGEGAKPIITGSPLDAENPENWTLHLETEDGAKIWKYKDKAPSCGVILLNGGELVCKQVYPGWNGKRFVNSDGSNFDLQSALYADLMFFTELNLKQKTSKNFSIDAKIKGPLYLRCDAGNPGEVYDEIEISMLDAGCTPSIKGKSTADNLHFRCYTDSGFSASSGTMSALVQNCEISWCGGGIQRYEKTHFDRYGVGISGGGILLFGESITAKDNYIHDCENKGIAVVINKGHSTYIRKNILAEDNVIDRCGNGIYLYINPEVKQKKVFENIAFRSNAIINSGMGWRAQNRWMLRADNLELGTGLNLTYIKKTGDVTFENNLFCGAWGPLVRRMFMEEINADDLPVMHGNTFAQNENMLLVTTRSENDDHPAPENSLAMRDEAAMAEAVCSYIGDDSGSFFLFE